MKCICKEFRIGWGDSIQTMNEWFLLHAEDIRIRTIAHAEMNRILVFYEEEPSDEKSRILVFDRVLQVIS